MTYNLSIIINVKGGKPEFSALSFSYIKCNTHNFYSYNVYSSITSFDFLFYTFGARSISPAFTSEIFETTGPANS